MRAAPPGTRYPSLDETRRNICDAVKAGNTFEERVDSLLFHAPLSVNTKLNDWFQVIFSAFKDEDAFPPFVSLVNSISDEMELEVVALIGWIITERYDYDTTAFRHKQLGAMLHSSASSIWKKHYWRDSNYESAVNATFEAVTKNLREGDRTEDPLLLKAIELAKGDQYYAPHQSPHDREYQSLSAYTDILQSLTPYRWLDPDKFQYHASVKTLNDVARTTINNFILVVQNSEHSNVRMSTYFLELYYLVKVGDGTSSYVDYEEVVVGRLNQDYFMVSRT